MDRIIKQCNPVQGVGWGQTPTLDLQLGPRYRQIILEVWVVNANTYIPTILDVLDMIIVNIGGNPQRMHTAWELNEINRSYGAQYAVNAYKTVNGAIAWANSGVPAAPAAGDAGGTIGTVFYIPIYFREPWRNSYAAQEMYAWYTAWQDGSVLPSFQLSLKVPALSTNIRAASAITINAFAETDNAVGPLDASKRPVMMITKWKRQPLTYSGIGDAVYTNLAKRELYSQISLFSSYATGKGPLLAGITPAALITDQNDITTPAFDVITRAKIEVDNRTVRDVTKIINDQGLIDDNMNEAGLPPDRLDVIFDKSDLPTDGLVMEAGSQVVRDFRLTATIGGAAAVGLYKTITALMQVYGAVER